MTASLNIQIGVKTIIESIHDDDQLQMYADYKKKRMWLDPQDVENKKESEILLKY